jgi:translation initiation factor 1
MAKRRDLTPTEALSSNPFAALASIRDELPPGTAPSEPETPTPTKPARGPARAVVRYQRKGRGGKEVTVVDQLGLAPELLDEWCRELKRALGCGGKVEGEVLVFGGDQRARLPAMLEARGARRITVS